MFLAAPTMGLSGIIMCVAFALYNFDLFRRFVAPASRLAQQRVSSSVVESRRGVAGRSADLRTP